MAGEAATLEAVLRQLTALEQRDAAEQAMLQALQSRIEVCVSLQHLDVLQVFFVVKLHLLSPNAERQCPRQRQRGGV